MVSLARLDLQTLICTPGIEYRTLQFVLDMSYSGCMWCAIVC